MTLTQLFTAIANQIRRIKGTSGTIVAENFPTEMSSIELGNLSNEEYAEANNDLDDIFEGVIIPNTYQQIEYIQLSGEQYIDTNYALWTNTNWKIEYKFDVNEFYDYNNMIGSLETYNANNEIWIPSDGNYYIRFTGVAKTSLGILELNIPYTIIHDNTGTNLLNYVNGELVQTSNKANTSLNYKLGLGHREGAKFLKGKIYYAKFWNGNELVRNFVPVIRKSDNKIGLYDLVTNEFYMNAGTGSFIAGGNVDILNTKIKNILEEKNIKALPENIKKDINILGVTGTYVGNLTDTEYAKANADLDNILYQSENVLPDAYQQVEYLESTGTQYINTGVSYANDLLVKDKVLYTVLDEELSTRTIYRISGVSATLYWGVGKRGNTSIWTWCAGSVTSVPVQTHTKYNLEINMSTNEVYANGDLVGSRTTTSTGSGNMYLFASKNATKDEVNSFEYDIRRYRTEFYKSGILIRNFVPCYRKADNEAGMYDTVNGVFYTNEGTGDFVVGEDVDVLNTKIESVLTEKAIKLIPENIKSGVNILGIIGTYTGN
ncbi:MAG: hypothetical protein IJK18_08410 [Clostridia bacterium]|nr:hypothetical protein [Clostridia bacterium]